MSMAVDLSTPLTPDEAKYLAERGRDAELHGAAERHEQDVNELLSDTSGDGTGPRVMQLNTGLRQVESADELLARLREMGVNVKVDESQVDEDDSDVAPYENWKVSELDAELKRRNLPVTGDKTAKVNALYADDAAA
jgi:hypothetical protein